MYEMIFCSKVKSYPIFFFFLITLSQPSSSSLLFPNPFSPFLTETTFVLRPSPNNWQSEKPVIRFSHLYWNILHVLYHNMHHNPKLFILVALQVATEIFSINQHIPSAAVTQLVIIYKHLNISIKENLRNSKLHKL